MEAFGWDRMLKLQSLTPPASSFVASSLATNLLVYYDFIISNSFILFWTLYDYDLYKGGVFMICFMVTFTFFSQSSAKILTKCSLNFCHTWNSNKMVSNDSLKGNKA